MVGRGWQLERNSCKYGPLLCTARDSKHAQDTHLECPTVSWDLNKTVWRAGTKRSRGCEQKNTLSLRYNINCSHIMSGFANACTLTDTYSVTFPQTILSEVCNQCLIKQALLQSHPRTSAAGRQWFGPVAASCPAVWVQLLRCTDGAINCIAPGCTLKMTHGSPATWCSLTSKKHTFRRLPAKCQVDARQVRCLPLLCK